MLWEKESNKPGALYVNFFAQKGQFLQAFYEQGQLIKPSVSPKNDIIAAVSRNLGNKLFGKHEYLDAIKQYNDSLRNAKKESESISLAYANRSACFFHLKMYNECLVDIELAKAAGYPERLMPKLDRRTTDCLERIEEEGVKPDDFGLKLSYDPDEKCPCMANVLKIERNADGKSAIFAKEDIDVGKTVVIDDAFSTYLLTQYGWGCNICLKSNTNLVPCQNCSTALFCKDTCTDHYLHESECGLRVTDDSLISDTMMHEVRLILMVINMFGNADELIDFVEQTVAGDPNELPEHLMDDKSKYRAFLKLPIDAKSSELDCFTITTVGVYKTVMDIPKVQLMFQSEKHRRFLMHLIKFHAMITDENSILKKAMTDTNWNGCKALNCHTTKMKRFFKHSCAPNVLLGGRDEKAVFITIRPVKRGEQLLFFILDVLKESKRKRQQMLSEMFEFICKCSRCNGQVATPEQRRILVADPDYSTILSEAECNDDNFDESLMDKCASFLNRHGRIAWCPELGKIIEVYVKLLHIRLSASIHPISLLPVEMTKMRLNEE